MIKIKGLGLAVSRSRKGYNLIVALSEKIFRNIAQNL